MDKTCTKCGCESPEDNFHRDKSRSDGRAPWCKVCVKANSKRCYDARPREDRLRVKRAWQSRNRDHVNSYNNRWQKSNPDKHCAKVNLQRAKKSNATPPWLSSAQRGDMVKMYKLAKKFESLFGVSYHVDHIVPINGDNICGLHVPWNLQLLESKLNIKKSNIFEDE